MEEVAVFVACCVKAYCFGRKYLGHAGCVRVAEAVIYPDVAEEDDSFYKQTLCVGVGVVVVVVACV